MTGDHPTNFLYRNPALYDLVFRTAPTAPRLSGSRSEFAIERPGFTASGKATFEVDRRHQILTRHRTWELSDGRRATDLARFRLFFPMELEHHLEQHGFEAVEMFDNTDMRGTALDGSMLYVTATYRGAA